jgi:hypothetical protein
VCGWGHPQIGNFLHSSLFINSHSNKSVHGDLLNEIPTNFSDLRESRAVLVVFNSIDSILIW